MKMRRAVSGKQRVPRKQQGRDAPSALWTLTPTMDVGFMAGPAFYSS